jgi:formyltetrahydrofolate hydrolase
MTKLHRFHKDICFPDWFEESIKLFNNKLSNKQLICSYHATKKYDNFSREYQKVIRDLLSTTTISEELNKYIFEFAANKDTHEIKKVCYRFIMNELKCDVIFVVSSTGKVVTMFLNKNFDPHISLDRSLYEMQ